MALAKEGDLEELEYLQMERLRRSDSLTDGQREILDEHDALESRIKSDPEQLLREAGKALADAMTVLSKLIRSGKFRQQLKYTDGRLYAEKDEAGHVFTNLLHRMNRLLIVHARHGRPEMREALFFDAKMLAEAFIQQAQAHPSDFIGAAESSLTMPSVRARNPKYTADAEEIAKNIHLAEKHPAGEISDNRGRAGAHTHVLVANILNEIHWQRQQFEWEKQTLKVLQNFHETAEEYRGVELEQYLRHTRHVSNVEPLLACAALPPWEERPEAWVELVLKMVMDEFAALARRPKRNKALWDELERGGEAGLSPVNGRRRYLEKLCRNKFDQFVRAAHRKSAHGQGS